MMRSIVFAIVSVSIVLAGCNTVRGVGQDIEAAGKGIQKSTR
jgi:predicted small secreted protein